ncbi:unnamed protein product [Caenorhabditis bovis]|uniref:TFIIH C1-like domain-containing protein n=1 Tax=Caenorhabditis bovis TaxID=2654633 RepID=A0A8S1ENF6_9PELO|nr:unnamed protein product [Caenorhabditis bovis]
MLNDDDEQKGYTWEAGYADGLNIGEVLAEDDSGSIEKSIAKFIADSKKKSRQNLRPQKIRLGIMRHVMIVIDCSRFMTNKSMPPSRFAVVMKALHQFLDKFFEQNPIAQIGFITCKDRKAERLTPLTGNVRILKDALNSLTEAFTGGDFSLQNALQLASTNLNHNDSSPISNRGFICEQCGTRHCSIPVECSICRLTLVAAPQLARAFRHLLPLAPFTSLSVKNRQCAACELNIEVEGFMCGKCSSIFCIDCDSLLHESLHWKQLFNDRFLEGLLMASDIDQPVYDRRWFNNLEFLYVRDLILRGHHSQKFHQVYSTQECVAVFLVNIWYSILRDNVKIKFGLDNRLKFYSRIMYKEARKDIKSHAMGDQKRAKFYLAPMVRYSKLAFRQLVRLYDVDVCYTPMIYAKNFLESEKCRNSELSVTKEDSPLIVQFATDDPFILSSAAEMVYYCSSGVDVNCGCPKHDVRSKGFGSALLDKPELLADMVAQTRAKILDSNFSISLKIRINEHLPKTVDLCQKAEKAGVSYLCVHGRTPSQRSEPINEEVLRIIKLIDIPIVANGSITTRQEALDIVHRTGVDGVMVANGLLTNPTLFAGHDYTTEGCVKNFMRLSRDHGLDWMLYHQHLQYMLRPYSYITVSEEHVPVRENRSLRLVS